jgi:heme-degrading monooxygenase HmoA
VVKMTKQVKEDLSQARFMVSFISLLSSETRGYEQAAEQMMNEVDKQPGFIAAYSARDEGGVGITNSYWRDIDAIVKWKSHSAHQAIQDKGKKDWYQWYQLQVCEIKRSYEGRIG